MIGVLDYGVGNVASMMSMLRRVGADPRRAAAPGDLESCDAFVLPGVGAFDDVITRFRESGLADPLAELVLGDGRPLLGVCVGMQMLAEGSDEGDLPGLGWVPGRVRHLSNRVDPSMRLPAMGWFFTDPVVGHDVVPDSSGPQRYYYVHSYHFECDDPDDVAATVDYGVPITAAVRRGSLTGTQFHPEKSHRFGMELLRHFSARVVA